MNNFIKNAIIGYVSYKRGAKAEADAQYERSQQEAEAARRQAQIDEARRQFDEEMGLRRDALAWAKDPTNPDNRPPVKPPKYTKFDVLKEFNKAIETGSMTPESAWNLYGPMYADADGFGPAELPRIQRDPDVVYKEWQTDVGARNRASVIAGAKLAPDVESYLQNARDAMIPALPLNLQRAIVGHQEQQDAIRAEGMGDPDAGLLAKALPAASPDVEQAERMLGYMVPGSVSNMTQEGAERLKIMRENAKNDTEIASARLELDKVKEANRMAIAEAQLAIDRAKVEISRFNAHTSRSKASSAAGGGGFGVRRPMTDSSYNSSIRALNTAWAQAKKAQRTAAINVQKYTEMYPAMQAGGDATPEALIQVKYKGQEAQAVLDESKAYLGSIEQQIRDLKYLYSNPGQLPPKGGVPVNGGGKAAPAEKNWYQKGAGAVTGTGRIGTLGPMGGGKPPPGLQVPSEAAVKRAVDAMLKKAGFK